MNKKAIITSELIKASLILLFVFTNPFGMHLSAQSAEPTYSIDIVDASSYGESDGSIRIDIESGQADFNYLLFNNDPKDGSEAIAYTEKVSEYTYTFTALKAGIYFVCVVDAQDNSRCQKVEVKNK